MTLTTFEAQWPFQLHGKFNYSTVGLNSSGPNNSPPARNAPSSRLSELFAVLPHQTAWPVSDPTFPVTARICFSTRCHNDHVFCARSLTSALVTPNPKGPSAS
ncbi:hypothetical protein NX059_003139 [Plenodomus lindquistii]|nr:hypothetical protein NX059_003139 [Plenodomus lindquistii]